MQRVSLGKVNHHRKAVREVSSVGWEYNIQGVTEP